METVIKLTKCKDEIFELLNALSKQITNIESCLGVRDKQRHEAVLEEAQDLFE